MVASKARWQLPLLPGRLSPPLGRTSIYFGRIGAAHLERYLLRAIGVRSFRCINWMPDSIGSTTPTAQRRRYQNGLDLRLRTWCDEDNARLRPLLLPNLRVELVKFFPRLLFS